MTSRCGLLERWTALVVGAPDGTVVPLCPEVLGDDWATIRARLADIDSISLPSLSDLMRDKDCDNVLNRAGDEVWTVERRRRTIRLSRQRPQLLLSARGMPENRPSRSGLSRLSWRVRFQNRSGRSGELGTQRRPAEWPRRAFVAEKDRALLVTEPIALPPTARFP
jgi:hypothetical protein